MSTKLQIALFTSGRFHLCDLARELIELGHQTTLYSLVPPWRTRKFGLPRQSVMWLGPKLLPTLLRLSMTRSASVKRRLRERLVTQLDQAAAKVLQPCDVFIGMSGMSNLVARRAKEAFHAQVRIQRCSRHILSQQAILKAIPNAEQVSDFDVERELIDYAQADCIDVPAQHCLESFFEQGFPRDRLFSNPFGVDLSCFTATPTPPTPITFIMVGTWSLRKGCDILLQAWRELPGTRLMHVGPVGDLALPADANFTHYDSVPQHELPKFYAQAHVMCLASREEGLAFVQPQALACGLRLVCTERTGGADLKSYVSNGDAIRVVNVDDPVAFSHIMQASATAALRDSACLRDLLHDQGRRSLSWSAYAQRYADALIAARNSPQNA